MAKYYRISRSDLFVLMGELALPPFEDHPEADHWECAPMAEKIAARVDEFLKNKETA